FAYISATTIGFPPTWVNGSCAGLYLPNLNPIANVHFTVQAVGGNALGTIMLSTPTVIDM
ncbi:MAG: hypothetical protein KDB80_09340, partial [Planctomycetes bacterium]|nr:hypothetical protein [Planctomycetota bacterium]